MPAGQTSFVGRQPAARRRRSTPASCSSRSTPVEVAQRAREARRRRCASGEVARRARSSRPTSRSKLQDAINLAGTAPPTVEVLYNGEDPIKRAAASSRRSSRAWPTPTGALSDKLTRAGGAATCGMLLKGGDVLVLGHEVRRPRASQRSKRDRSSARCARCRRTPSRRARRSRSSHFAQIAIDNLGLSDKVLAAGRPAAGGQAHDRSRGQRTPLDAFAVAIVGDRLADVRHRAAGRRACSRSSARSTPSGGSCAGSSRASALLGEKVALAAPCAFAVTLRHALRHRRSSSQLDWGRFAAVAARRWPAARSPSARSGSRSARSRARCAPRRCWPSCSPLPIAFLALVPAGAVAGWLYDVIRVVSALFPFRPALQAVDAALNDAEPGLGPTLAHLAVARRRLPGARPRGAARASR